jgi:hypothetical protein
LAAGANHAEEAISATASSATAAAAAQLADARLVRAVATEVESFVRPSDGRRGATYRIEYYAVRRSRRKGASAHKEGLEASAEDLVDIGGGDEWAEGGVSKEEAMRLHGLFIALLEAAFPGCECRVQGWAGRRLHQPRKIKT